MLKICTIIGARPQFIKASTISREVNKYDDIEEIIIHTGQHFDHNMSKIFFEEMNIPKPKYNLNINSLSHGAMTGRMIENIENVLLKEKPDMVMVYGDTNSTIAGSLAAKKLHIKVAHVEAGLRSYNNKMPEEINRILTDRISNFLFCPAENAVSNLKKEGFDNITCDIYKTGDVMYDATKYYSSKSKKPDIFIPDNYIVATIHREENTKNKERFKNIWEALNEISKNIPIIIPAHPRTRQIINNENNVGIIVSDPVSYLEMIWLLKNSDAVITDSGGLQKEAYFFNRYCITLRDETEWEELIEEQVNFLAGADKNRIINLTKKYANKNIEHGNIYGDGNASKKIVNIIRSENRIS